MLHKLTRPLKRYSIRVNTHFAALHCAALTVLGCLLVGSIFAQRVNGYARVTTQTDSMLVISNVDETHDSFEVDEQLILIQVQDNTLGSTANSSAFGGLGSIGSAGLFEVFDIEEVRETGGIPDTLILKQTPVNSYSTGSNARLMVVTYPQLGSPDYTVNSSLSAPSWNGNTGGVIAFQVANNLYLEQSISADGAGFRGGSVSNNQAQPNDCDGSVYRSSNGDFGEKGEGIHRRTDANNRYGRGRMLNGGGGGVGHNGGGGGGGSYTAGGMGGAGWNSGSGCSPSISGFGGLSLSGYISPTRVFMGGGGGGGQHNNNNGTSGADGGGMIFIRADSIITNSSCSVSISANGGTAADGGNDAAGGGGGGGSIILEVNGFAIDAGCPLSISANGGDGGASVTSTVHSGGGGGGQGTVVFSGPQPTTNVTAHTLNGTGGCDNTPCDSRAADGSGSDNVGILTGMPSLLNTLSVELVALSDNGSVELDWSVSGIEQVGVAGILRSADASEWTILEQRTIVADGERLTSDHPGRGQWYYKVQVTDNGRVSESPVRAVELKEGNAATFIRQLYPNPVEEELTVRFEERFTGECRIHTTTGNLMAKSFVYAEVQSEFDVSALPSGVYFFEVYSPNGREVQRFVKR